MRRADFDICTLEMLHTMRRLQMVDLRGIKEAAPCNSAVRELDVVMLAAVEEFLAVSLPDCRLVWDRSSSSSDEEDSDDG